MHHHLKGLLSYSLLTSLLATPLMAQAEEPMPTYTLDSTVVTATRTAKSELDTPNSIAVLSEQQLQATGAENMQEALAKVNGITYKSFGPNGAAMGGMTNEVAIRGVSNGTLILLNGAPLNQQGKYYLDAIPVNTVKKVEIIKGGSSVLYGSDAMSGVINIITKKEYSNNVGLGLGNYGQRNYQVQAGVDKLSVSYTKDKWGGKVRDLLESTDPKGFLRLTDALGSTKESLNLTYNINDKLDFLYNRYKTEAEYLVHRNNNEFIKQSKYTNTQDYYQLIYRNRKLKGNFFYNDTDLNTISDELVSANSTSKHKPGKPEAAKPAKPAKSATPKLVHKNTTTKYKTYGFDLHKKFDVDDNRNVVAGLAYEKQSIDSTGVQDHSRNVYSLYAQWDQNLNKRNEWLFGLRSTWAHAGEAGFNYKNLSGSTSFLHKLNNNETLYVNIAQSFIMPTLNQMYGTSKAEPNPNLKPQKGINYELGWKKKHNIHNWKVALFAMHIKDNITGYQIAGKIHHKNEEFKNYGIEIEDNFATNQHLSYNWGVTYQNPKTKTNNSKEKDYWDNKYGRWQLTGGVNYNYKKLNSSLQGSYSADRVTTPTKSHSYKVKPYFLTSFTSTYKPTDRQSISLTVDNLLNRRDNIGHTGTIINTVGRNFRLNYNYAF